MNVYKRTNGPHIPPRAESGKVCSKEPDSNHLEAFWVTASVLQLYSTTGEGSIQREYEQAGTPELHATSLIDTVWSPRLRLEGTKERKEVSDKQINNKNRQRYPFKPGSQGDGPYLRAWISRPCANVQILTSFVVVFGHWGLRCHPGAFRA